MNKLDKILHSAARRMGGETKAKRIAIMSIVAVIIVTLVSATFIINTSDDSVAEEDITVNGCVYTINDVTKTATLKQLIDKTTPVKVTIPGSVQKGGVGELYTVTAIGNQAFIDCSGLTSVTIPSGVTSIGNSAFINCTGLTSVTIPNSVTVIGEFVFFGCTVLTSVTIPSGVTSIGNYAFTDCALLASATIPNSVTSIGNSAFYGCALLTSVDLKSVTSIGDGAFTNCTGLTSVTIPSGVTSIGDGAFRGCLKLTSITVGADNPNYSSIDGVLFNKNKTTLMQYPGGKPGTTYDIPNSVTIISSSAFVNCTSLTSVTIPNSARISTGAFYNCSSLVKVIITGTGIAPTDDSDVISKYFKDTKWGLPGRTTGITTLTLEFNSGYDYDLSDITTKDKGTIIFGADAKATKGGEFYTANGILYTDSRAGLTFTLNDSKWKTDNIYGVNFIANGGTGYMSDQFFEKGVSGTLEQNDFTRTGYVFDGWNTQEDGKGKSYPNGGSITFPLDGEFNTLCAVWTPGKYTLSFNPNGGSVTPASKEVTYDSAIGDLPIPTKDGYKFVGWYIGDIRIDENYVWKFTPGQTAIAVWGHAATASSGKGGSISPDGKIIVADGTDKKFTITADKGFKIKDVTVDGVSVGAVSTYTFSKVTGDHTIYAEFERTSPEPGPANPTNPDASNGLYLGFIAVFAVLLASLVAVLFKLKK